MTITDIVYVGDQEVEVRLLGRPCRNLAGKRVRRDGSSITAKASGCHSTAENHQQPVYTPVYNCALYGRCAPFAERIDDEADPVKPCINCDSRTVSSGLIV